MVVSSFARGLGRAGKNIRLLFIVYAATFLAAAMLTYPVYRMLRSTLGMTSISEQMFHYFPMNWISAWFCHNNMAIHGFQHVLLAGGISFVLFYVFLLGGILEILTKPDQKFSLSRFFQGIGNNISGFTFLFILSSAVYFVIVWKGNSLLQDAGEKIYERWPGEWTDLILMWSRWIIIGAVIAGCNALFDYARILYVLRRSRWMLAALVRAWWFMLAHVWKTFWIYYLLALMAGLVIAGYMYAVDQIAPRSIREIGIIFGIQQVYIILRTWIRLSFYAGQTILYEKLYPLTNKEELIDAGELHSEFDSE